MTAPCPRCIATSGGWLCVTGCSGGPKISTITVSRKTGSMRVQVERRALSPAAARIEDAYVITGGRRKVIAYPLAREVSRLLKDEPMRFPEVLR